MRYTKTDNIEYMTPVTGFDVVDMNTETWGVFDTFAEAKRAFKERGNKAGEHYSLMEWRDGLLSGSYLVYWDGARSQWVFNRLT